ncbi:uncharacterized protein GGS25DRAFT_527633 [Hypoxylon fragiforme]|uniref:uncharacterized protein n=1 Tax=Hypoxylon fragiforme TaxID=63214 RepID=UPI0020C71F8F|nr:uncharacterized protein GGS25DRAFT_527633 [Hypoxylon fragiforme]KAI2614521.1 hypothetical protein GGS25DRAFT_527633 [Hypoxylon fragiforme]
MEKIQRLVHPVFKKKRHRTDNSGFTGDQAGADLATSQQGNELQPTMRTGDIDIAPMNFTPQSQGRDATLAFMNSGYADHLIQLLDDQDRAERLLHEGPQTKGTQEVQHILREPTLGSLEKFNDIRRQAEINKKYGFPGEVVFNFSRTVGWNKSKAAASTPLQLRGHRNVRKRGCKYVPRTPHTPIDWLDLGRSTTPASNNGQPLTPEIEPPFNPWSSHNRSLDLDLYEASWVEEEARIMAITKLPLRTVRMIHTIPPERGN